MNKTLNITQSELMSAYNAAKKARCFEPKRLNRALGIVQRNSTVLVGAQLDVTSDKDFHLATVKRCDCEDFRMTRGWCKHRIARALIVKAERLKDGKKTESV
jgi:hypothetical protein